MPHPSRRRSLLALLALLATLLPAARPAQAASFVVTNFTDATPAPAGSLRAAIESANAGAGADTITFSGPGTINLVDPLPALSGGNITIDGTQAATGNTPRVELRGSSAGVGTVSGSGIFITSSGNTVRGLIINGFGGPGVEIAGTGANNNSVRDNYIGTNSAGNNFGHTPRQNNNSGGGVVIVDGASGNTVDGNVISGNGASQGFGVLIAPGTLITGDVNNGNTISNNKIGVDVSGTVALANGKSGVFIGNNSNNTNIGPGNVISGNGLSATLDFGVIIVGELTRGGGFITGNKVFGNRIGTSADGQSAIPNAAGGVRVDYSQATIIGGAAAPNSPNADRGNLISGNVGNGVVVQQSNVTLQQFDSNIQILNNWIGLRASGDQGLGNAGAKSGISIENRARKVSVVGNVISGNRDSGVQLVGTNPQRVTDKTRAITIERNIIGANTEGTAGSGQQIYGVRVLGGVVDSVIDNNRISGNAAAGISFELAAEGVPSNNTVSNNQIGTLAQGNTPIGNGDAGVQIVDGTGNTIGPNNTIARHTNGQSGDGVLLVGIGTAQNTVKANTIYANFYGIRIDDSSAGNIIGGSAPADGNIVRENQQGILVSGNAFNNRITRTRTSANVGSGIALFSGGNRQIATPNVSNVSVSGTAPNLTLAGTLTSNADCSGAGCTVEVFQSTTREDKEGPFFLTAFARTGGTTFSTSIASCMPFLTFTITDKDGNTSEFTNALGPIAGCTAGEPTQGAVPDLTNVVPPSQSVASGPVSFSATLTNVGTGAGTFRLSVIGLPSQWNATVAPTSVTLGPNAAQQVQVSATIPANFDAGRYVATLTATTEGSAASDSIQATIDVPLTPALSFSAATQPTQQAGPGQRVCFDHTLRNLGNGTDTFRIAVAPPTQPQPWAFTVQPGELIELPRNGQQTVTVCVTVPAGNTPSGDYNTTVTASSESGAKPSAPAVVDVTQVRPAAVPQISPAAPQNVTPAPGGVPVTFEHQISNVGNAADKFTLAVASLPPGWTLQTPPPAEIGPITPGAAPTTVSYVVRVPANALAGSYGIVFRATAQQGASPASASVTDVVNVARVASITLTPEQRASDEPPATEVAYEFTLGNDGNFTDTVTLSLGLSQAGSGWTARTEPASPAVVPARSSIAVRVIVTIPPGQAAGTQNVTTLTATSSEPAASDQAQATTTIEAVPGVQLLPKDPVRVASAGETVTFTLTLLNSGSIPQRYTTSVVSPTAGLQYTFQGVDPNITFTPGQTATLLLAISVPENQDEGTSLSATVRAVSNQGGRPAETTATVRVGPPYGVQIDPDRASTNLPGALVQYTHYLTNTGRFTDTYSLSAIASLAWETSVTPRSVRLLPGASAVVAVTVRVPTSAEANLTNTTIVLARSTTDQNVEDQSIDTTTVLQVAGVNIAPSRTATLVPGRTVTFQHVLLNTGNGTDTFTITATQTLNWGITLSTNETPRIVRGVSFPVQVQIRIPANADPNLANQITLRATSRHNGSVYEEVVDTIRPVTLDSDYQATLYLPLVQR